MFVVTASNHSGLTLQMPTLRAAYSDPPTATALLLWPGEAQAKSSSYHPQLRQVS